MNFNAGIEWADGRAPQVVGPHGGCADQDDLIREGACCNPSLENIGYGNVRKGFWRPQVVDQQLTIFIRRYEPFPQLNPLHPVARYLDHQLRFVEVVPDTQYR